MLAIPERAPGRDGALDQLIWHKPIGRGDGLYQGIACGEPGITLPSGKMPVPLKLNKPNESWCTDCLEAIRSNRVKTSEGE